MVEGDMRVAVDKLLKGGAPGDVGGGIDVQDVQVHRTFGLQLRAGQLQLVDDIGHVEVKLLAILTEPDVPPHPVEKGDAQLFLQAADGSAQGGRGDIQFGGGLEQVLPLCQGFEIVQLLQLHGPLLSRQGFRPGATWGHGDAD